MQGIKSIPKKLNITTLNAMLVGEMDEKIDIYVIGHMEDNAGHYDGTPAKYWASMRYKAQKLPDGKFLLTPLEFNIHAKMGVLESFCLSVDKDHDKTIHINDSVWETNDNGKGIEGKLTLEGTQKIGDYLRSNYVQVFKPAHVVN
jgi:hypothetical protein